MSNSDSDDQDREPKRYLDAEKNLDAEDKDTCAYCGSKVIDIGQKVKQWVPLLRFNNIAEAGYCCDLLTEESIISKMHHQDEFSAIIDTWESSFIVLVDEKEENRASAFLEVEYKENRFEGELHETTRPDASLLDRAKKSEDDHLRENTSGLHWRSRIYSFLTGIMFCWFIVYVTKNRDPLVIDYDTQPAFGSIAKGQELKNYSGKPTHWLNYDNTDDVFILTTDTDGDGIPDNTYRFQK